jgi:hypothetical protein
MNKPTTTETAAVDRQHIDDAVHAISRVIQDLSSISHNSGLCIRGQQALTYLAERARRSVIEAE